MWTLKNNKPCPKSQSTYSTSLRVTTMTTTTIEGVTAILEFASYHDDACQIHLHSKWSTISSDSISEPCEFRKRKRKKKKKLYLEPSSIEKGLAPTFTRVEVGVLKTFSREPFTNKTPSFPFEICTFTTWSRQSWRNLWMGSKALNNENVFKNTWCQCS